MKISEPVQVYLSSYIRLRGSVSQQGRRRVRLLGPGQLRQQRGHPTTRGVPHPRGGRLDRGQQQERHPELKEVKISLNKPFWSLLGPGQLCKQRGHPWGHPHPRGGHQDRGQQQERHLDFKEVKISLNKPFLGFFLICQILI